MARLSKWRAKELADAVCFGGRRTAAEAQSTNMQVNGVRQWALGLALRALASSLYLFE